MTAPIVLDEEQRNAAVAELMRRGARDSSAATRIVDAITKHGHTIADMPAHEVETVMRDLNIFDRYALAEALTHSETRGKQPWPAWLQDALAAAADSDAITAARGALLRSLAAAELAVRRVRDIHARLADELRDPEYAADDRDLLPYLINQSHRAIRAAAAVNPIRD